MQTELAIHPISMLIPRPTAEEHAATRRSIAKDGLLEGMEIWTYPDNGEEKVLDGNTRQACCLEENIEPRYRPYTGDDPVAFVLAMNLSRRHLGSASQRRKIAASLLKLHPEWPNRRIARESGYNRTDVGDLRREIDPVVMSETDITLQTEHPSRTTKTGEPRKAPGRQPLTAAQKKERDDAKKAAEKAARAAKSAPRLGTSREQAIVVWSPLFQSDTVQSVTDLAMIYKSFEGVIQQRCSTTQLDNCLQLIVKAFGRKFTHKPVSRITDERPS
jgi:hypothetical protein